MIIISYFFGNSRKVEQMKKPKIETFGLTAIQTVLSNATDLQTARKSLAFAVGAAVDVLGKVQKVVKRNGQCRLVIEPDDESGFVVFADCLSDAEIVIKRKIRKGSLVRVKGKFQAFGALAVNLSDCRLR
jgi:hypothetical protein